METLVLDTVSKTLLIRDTDLAALCSNIERFHRKNGRLPDKDDLLVMMIPHDAANRKKASASSSIAAAVAAASEVDKNKHPKLRTRGVLLSAAADRDGDASNKATPSMAAEEETSGNKRNRRGGIVDDAAVEDVEEVAAEAEDSDAAKSKKSRMGMTAIDTVAAAIEADKAARGLKKQRSTNLLTKRWTKDMDAALLEAVKRYGRQWKLVAAEIGGNMDGISCCFRWIHYVDPQLVHFKTGPWSEAEVQQLHELVKEHTYDPTTHKAVTPNYDPATLKAIVIENEEDVAASAEESPYPARQSRVCIDWHAISRKMNRSYQNVKGKWNTMKKSLHNAQLKKGPFTPEEDAIIVQRVEEWGNKGIGLWKSLEVELGRPAFNLRSRWNTSLSKVILQPEQQMQSVV